VQGRAPPYTATLRRHLLDVQEGVRVVHAVALWVLGHFCLVPAGQGRAYGRCKEAVTLTRTWGGNHVAASSVGCSLLLGFGDLRGPSQCGQCTRMV